jgi:glutaredoxin
MKSGFYCPHCEKNLGDQSTGDVVMTGRLHGAHFHVDSEFRLSSKLGEYGGKWAEYLLLEPGAIVEFFCPHCHKSLNAIFHRDLAAIDMVREDGSKAQVCFHRTFGTEASLVIDSKESAITASYGRDKEKYEADWHKMMAMFLHKM